MTFKDACIEISRWPMGFCLWVAHEVTYEWKMRRDERYRVAPRERRKLLRKAHDNLRNFDPRSTYADNRKQAESLVLGNGSVYTEPPVLVYDDPDAATKFQTEWEPDDNDEEIDAMLDGVANQIKQEFAKTAQAFKSVGKATDELGEKIKAMAPPLVNSNSAYGSVSGGMIITGGTTMFTTSQPVGSLYPVQIYYNVSDNTYTGVEVNGTQANFIPVPVVGSPTYAPANFQGQKTGQVVAFRRTSDGRLLVDEAQMIAMMEELGFTQIG